MKILKVVLPLSFLVLSFQLTVDFSSPKAVIETLFRASSVLDRDLLANCFSPNSPSEWDKIRNKTISDKELLEVKEFFADAEITKIEIKDETNAIVYVKLKTRNEQIHTVKENERWYVSDF